MLYVLSFRAHSTMHCLLVSTTSERAPSLSKLSCTHLSVQTLPASGGGGRCLTTANRPTWTRSHGSIRHKRLPSACQIHPRVPSATQTADACQTHSHQPDSQRQAVALQTLSGTTGLGAAGVQQGDTSSSAPQPLATGAVACRSCNCRNTGPQGNCKEHSSNLSACRAAQMGNAKQPAGVQWRRGWTSRRWC
jgi:hypothetical protein